jgi:hypothetical protein
MSAGPTVADLEESAPARKVKTDTQSQSGVPSGDVEVLTVDDDQLCIAFDFELSRDDELVAAAKGVIAVPVVRSPTNIYFF